MRGSARRGAAWTGAAKGRPSPGSRLAIGPSHARHARDCSPYGGSDAATLLCDKANSSFFNVPGEDAIRRLGVTQAKGQLDADTGLVHCRDGRRAANNELLPPTEDISGEVNYTIRAAEIKATSQQSFIASYREQLYDAQPSPPPPCPRPSLTRLSSLIDPLS